MSRLFEEDVKIKSCGRTDAGVHAYMHISNFFLKNEILIPHDKLVTVINTYLPGDIVCTNVEIVSESFNSRRDAKFRQYMYVIYNDEVRPPFYKKRTWHIKENVNTRKLKKALLYIKGTHDFASFCASAKEYNHTVRTITKVKVIKEKKYIKIYITGFAFLHKMIRMIVGSAVDIVLKNKPSNEMKKILENKSRNNNPYITAPPGGLYLYKIEY